MGIYNLQDPYGLSTWYENQGINDLWTGTDVQLDLVRRILESDAYIFQGVGFPKGRDIYVPPGQTFSGTLNLTPYSYVLYVTGWSGSADNWSGGLAANQFTMRLYDKGAQTDVYAKQFAWYPVVISNMAGQPNLGEIIIANDLNKPFGPYFFRDPLIVLPPGVLQIQLTNVVTDPQAPTGIVQLFFAVAVPKNTISLNTRKVIMASDPTGTQTLQGDL